LIVRTGLKKKWMLINMAFLLLSFVIARLY
jgi:hypothetical protein